MTKGRLSQLITSPQGRITLSLIGLAAVILLLRHTGPDAVLATIRRAASLFPLVLALEAAVLACTMRALKILYGPDGHRLKTGVLVRAGLIGYAVMGLVPAGRTFAETTRAAFLARYSTGPRALVAATRLQAIALLANSGVSFLAALAMARVLGATWPTALIAGNMVITAVVGMGILLACQRSSVGGWLGKRLPGVRDFGQEFDHLFASRELIPWAALGWEFAGRLVQVFQNGILVLAVGGASGLLPAFCSEALHLVGAAVGDLIPAQLGATELNYQLSSGALGLQPADALAIALLAHLAQLSWVVVGLFVPIFWPLPDAAPVFD